MISLFKEVLRFKNNTWYIKTRIYGNNVYNHPLRLNKRHCNLFLANLLKKKITSLQFEKIIILLQNIEWELLCPRFFWQVILFLFILFIFPFRAVQLLILWGKNLCKINRMAHFIFSFYGNALLNPANKFLLKRLYLASDTTSVRSAKVLMGLLYYWRESMYYNYNI